MRTLSPSAERSRIRAGLDSSETHFSTEQSQAKAPPRLSCPYGHEGGASNHQESARQGTEQAERLSSGSEATPRRARFPRAFRLTRARDFERVFAGAFRSTGEGVRVLARANGQGCARLGLAISRRRVRKAVCRNRLKRVIRESFRHHCPELGSLDVVVLARSGLDRIGNSELHRLLAGHWHSLARRRS